MLQYATHRTQNSWEPAFYMSSMSQNFPFVSRIEFIRSKLSIFLLMYPWSVDPRAADQRSARGGSAAGQGGHQKTGGTDYRITRLGNVPDCITQQCVCAGVNVTIRL